MVSGTHKAREPGQQHPLTKRRHPGPSRLRHLPALADATPTAQAAADSPRTGRTPRRWTDSGSGRPSRAGNSDPAACSLSRPSRHNAPRPSPASPSAAARASVGQGRKAAISPSGTEPIRGTKRHQSQRVRIRPVQVVHG